MCQRHHPPFSMRSAEASVLVAKNCKQGRRVSGEGSDMAPLTPAAPCSCRVHSQLPMPHLRCQQCNSVDLEDGQHAAGGDVVAVEEAQRVGCRGGSQGMRRVSVAREQPKATHPPAAALRGARCTEYHAATHKGKCNRKQPRAKTLQGLHVPMGSHIRLIDWSLPPWLLNQSAGQEGRQAGQQSGTWGAASWARVVRASCGLPSKMRT